MTDELKARVEKTIKNLKRNNMDAYFCENAEEARELVINDCGSIRIADEVEDIDVRKLV